MPKKKRQRWTPEKVIARIRSRAVHNKSISNKDVAADDSPLTNAATKYFKGWRQAVESAGFDYDSVRKQKSWTQDSVKSRIQTRKREGRALNPSAVISEENALYQAGMAHYGSWKKAVLASGYVYEDIVKVIPVRWSEKKICSRIRKRISDGLSVSHDDVYRKERRLFSAARRRYGTWRAAVEAAGIDYESVRKQTVWSYGKIIARIQDRARQGLPLNCRAVRDSGNAALEKAAQAHFGSWQKAIEAAGFVREDVFKRKQWSKTVVIARIHERAFHGKPLNYKKVRFENSKLLGAAVKYFGSWQTAIEKAGYSYEEIRMHQRWSQACVIAHIQADNRAQLPLNTWAVIQRNERLYAAAMNHFGTWKRAIEASGLSYDRICMYTQWTESLVIAGIVERTSLGLPLSAAYVSRNDARLFCSARKFFKTWEAAVNAAGYDYDLIIKRWSFRRRKSHMQPYRKR